MADQIPTRTPRSKSIAAKPKALTLRPHEARRLAEAGEVLIVREVKLVQFGPSDTPGYDWNFRRGPGGVWEDYRTAGLLASKYCPFGPVGSMLWGREKHWRNGYMSGWCGADPVEPYWVTPRPACGHEEASGIAGLFVRFEDPGDAQHWRPSGATFLPRWASRLPRLRHESCEVKRADALTFDDLAAMGLPDGPDRIVKPGSSPIEYIEIKPADMVAQLHGIPADRWAWCSLVVDLDRLEVADA